MAISLMLVAIIIISVILGVISPGKMYTLQNVEAPTPSKPPLPTVTPDDVGQWEPIGTDGATFKNSKTGEYKSWEELQGGIGN